MHAIHEVERRADDPVVLAQGERARHRETRLPQRGDDPVLPVHGVRRGQELARGLAAQHVLPAASRDMIGRVGLATPELAHFERAAEALHVLAHVTLKRARVESVGFADLGGLRDHLPRSPPVRAPV